MNEPGTSTTPVLTSAPEIGTLYGSEVQAAFEMNYTSNIMIAVSMTEPAKDIETMVESVINYSLSLPKPIEKEIPTEITEAKRYILKELEESERFKVLLAASSMSLMNKYFPKITEYRDRFRNGNRKIAHAMLKNLPYLVTENGFSWQKKRDAGHVLAALIESANLNEKNIRNDAFDELIVILTLIRNWTGENVRVIKEIVKLAGKYDEKYEKNDINHPPARTLLPLLLTGYPTAGTIDIDQWYHGEANYKKCKVSYEKMVTDFADNVWPKMHSQAKKREAGVLNTKQRILLQTTIESIGCTEADFRSEQLGIAHQGGIHAIQTAGNKQEKTRVNKYATNPEKVLSILMRILNEQPEICPNCLRIHKLEDCNALADSPRENMAAYLMPNYSFTAKNLIPKSTVYTTTFIRRRRGYMTPSPQTMNASDNILTLSPNRSATVSTMRFRLTKTWSGDTPT
ncbi:hypothetical protein METBIDRAFT_29616 [Metschnikowia bicuspidata var. bicuspidata NRRL YB-4993]|uniref:Uncharacterized protein n=1 Tax=Metschnikowia bicuspidata var. bicuspidata NRRL YB-4993 TaxID=869754 RepID=A0A1A0HGS0_9ASCO|nr:hypothetical protein METBIDRAFT_29616 [Metschnikowia bicuspidata var. bicuspidata NRRL YB-4993]OBA23077.1 hypothetical protein METBIDRAFT_29616 [Metschnikowia bicuspidata var. bicuspidata NRRL YB-4993]